LKYLLVAGLVFLIEFILESLFRSHIEGSVLAPIYFVRLFILFYVLTATEYGTIKISEIIKYMEDRHRRETTLFMSFSETEKKLRTLLGSSKLHLLIMVVGVLLYNVVCFTPLNPMGPEATRSLVVPVVNSVWGATVVLAAVIITAIELLLLRMKIGHIRVELAHEDGVAGYGLVVKNLTRVFELMIVGLGVFFLSFYYFVNYNTIVITVLTALAVFFGLYSFIIYRLHLVIEKAKVVKLAELNQEIKRLEEIAEKAMGKGRIRDIVKAWYTLNQQREKRNDLKNLKTWPLGVNAIARITGVGMISWMLQTVIKILIELFIM
jgi:hypothetical protein